MRLHSLSHDGEVFLQRVRFRFCDKRLKCFGLLLYVRGFQSRIIAQFLLVTAFEVYKRVALPQKVKVHQQPRRASVAVNKRVDAYERVMEVCRYQHRMHLLFLHFLILSHKLLHLFFYEVRLWWNVLATRNHHGRCAVASSIFAIDAVKYKGVYLFDRALAYLYVVFCKVLDVVDSFPVVYRLQVLTH